MALREKFDFDADISDELAQDPEPVRTGAPIHHHPCFEHVGRRYPA